MSKQLKLSDAVKRVLVVAYQEDTAALERAFIAEGFKNIIVLRKQYSEKELSFSRQSRCLLSHHGAWELASESDGLSIIVEADFVPVKGMRNLPLPFGANREDDAWGWLYSCGQRVYELVDGICLRGHSATTVGYVIGPKAAKKIMPFLEFEFNQNDPYAYSPWDVYIRIFAQNAGVNMFLPYRSYGEHGGIPNKEHKLHGITQSHQADVLWGPLHFLPSYARGSIFLYWAFRLKAKAKAFLRLVSGRYIERQTIFNNRLPVGDRIKLIKIAFLRLLYPF